MGKIIGQEDYHDGMTRVVYEDLSVDVTSLKINEDVPCMWDVVEVMDTNGLISTGNIKLLKKTK